MTKHIDAPPLQFTEKVVDFPVVAQRQVHANRHVQKTIQIPQLQHTDQVVDVPVVVVAEVPQVHVVMKTVETSRVQIVAETTEIPQLPFVEKIEMIPEIETVQGPQTSESLSVDSRGLSHQDCEALFHVNKQSPDIAGGVHVDRDDLHAGNGARTAAVAQHRSTQQHKQEQRIEQGTQEGERDQREEGEKGEGERESVRKGERGKEEGGDAEEEECKQVKKDVTGWTVVTRQKKMVQIFVKVDEAKVTPIEVSLTDGKVEDVMRQVQKDEDVYVTMHGRVLGRNEMLKSCGVTDGCTIQVTSRMRGGGKHKDKKGQKERKRGTKPKGPEQKSEEEENRKVMVRMLEENEDNRKMIESISEGSDFEVEQALQNYRTAGREVLGWDQGQADLMERGLRWAAEARRKGRRQQEEEQQRQGEQGKDSTQDRNKASKASKWILAMRNRRERKTQTNRR